ncbi:hypothetical protein FJY84_07050 [Candidatus Bathyarchaeota archaeon]|nr:hypothetical protein [Candidatus Bathyarchaeota archaeon]
MGLKETAFETLKIGCILPGGWLKNQLRIQADGLSGHLEEHWPDVGPENGWRGGQGESWERGPYYLDGLVPLAYLLKDEGLIKKANCCMEWVLASQQENGLFGPKRIKTVNNDVDKKQDWWHFMIILKVLMQYEEATGDKRVIPFLNKFLLYLNSTIEEQPLRGWAAARGAEMLLCIQWLYKRNSESYLLDLANTVLKQTINWTDIFYDFPFWRKVETFDWRTHVVNVAMGIKTPGVIYEFTGDEREREAVHKGIDGLMIYHGQVHGMFSGDEWLAGSHPSQGVELCAIVEYMYSMEQLTRIFGEGKFGDILEKVSFNALPAAISPDWTSHQYDQQVNQILCNRAKRSWSSNGPEANMFGLEPQFGCCTANMHQGWPKLCSHLWMSDKEGGLVAVSYAPCTISTQVGTGTKAILKVSGEYPFREDVIMNLSMKDSELFTILFRIPAWCDTPVIAINGESMEFEITDGFAKIERKWYSGDSIQLHLPMKPLLKPRNMYAVGIERGPIVYVLPIKENWQQVAKRDKFHDWEIYPASPWKYGILSDTKFEVSTLKVPYQPFEAVNAPVRIKVKGKFIREWMMENNSAGSPPMFPCTEGQKTTDLELVPYGSARLRIGEFPLIDKRINNR